MHRRRLLAEPLEARQLLTTLTVNSALDNFAPASPTTDGVVTLREAIPAANTDAAVGDAAAGSGADTITFDNSLAGGTITLGGSQLQISGAVTIDGDLDDNGTADITIDANRLSRVFRIDDETSSEVTVAITGLTITGGDNLVSEGKVDLNYDDGGGGILNRESLTLTGSNVISNVAKGISGFFAGGGIFNSGTLSLTGSTVSSNTAQATTNGLGRWPPAEADHHQPFPVADRLLLVGLVRHELLPEAIGRRY